MVISDSLSTLTNNLFLETKGSYHQGGRNQKNYQQDSRDYRGGDRYGYNSGRSSGGGHYDRNTSYDDRSYDSYNQGYKNKKNYHDNRGGYHDGDYDGAHGGGHGGYDRSGGQGYSRDKYHYDARDKVMVVNDDGNNGDDDGDDGNNGDDDGDDDDGNNGDDNGDDDDGVE